MATNGQSPRLGWSAALDQVIGLDLRSLAVFRIGLAAVILVDLFNRFQDLTAHYTDAGVMPRTLLREVAPTFHWSLHALSGTVWFQGVLFAIAALIAIALLVGYRTRIATIASWALMVSLQNRNPTLLFAADYVLVALLFWSMFLPLGACYSMDSALNSSTRKLPERFASGATFALMVQQSFIYIFSAVIKGQGTAWNDGSAVYYALSFDQYATPIGRFLLNFPALMTLSTHITFVLEWLGPLLIFIPFRNSFFKMLAIALFVPLHIGFGLTLNLGIFPFLSVFSWLAFLPSDFWNRLFKRLQTPERKDLRIYYDADCGFCKKVVHFLRTLLVLPETPLLMAQDDPNIYADMQAYNSWVIVDWEGNRHFKFEGIAYVVSLSPIFGFLAPVLRWKPIMAIGTPFYETIASNRRAAGQFTKPFKFRPFEVKPSRSLTLIALGLLFYTTLWNIRSVFPDAFKRRTWQRTALIGQITRLDQNWSIFAPNPPRDDGWHVIPGQFVDGTEADLFRGGGPVSWDKPTLNERSSIYQTMQWRTYFLNLDRGIGEKLYPFYTRYLCQSWNAKRPQDQQLESFEIYFMDERTVPLGEQQSVEKTRTWEQSCSDSTNVQ
jgi:predicted DCC family thiol-disulfide oxidoreductase YuxK